MDESNFSHSFPPRFPECSPANLSPPRRCVFSQVGGMIRALEHFTRVLFTGGQSDVCAQFLYADLSSSSLGTSRFSPHLSEEQLNDLLCGEAPRHPPSHATRCSRTRTRVSQTPPADRSCLVWYTYALVSPRRSLGGFCRPSRPPCLSSPPTRWLVQPIRSKGLPACGPADQRVPGLEAGFRPPLRVRDSLQCGPLRQGAPGSAALWLLLLLFGVVDGDDDGGGGVSVSVRSTRSLALVWFASVGATQRWRSAILATKERYFHCSVHHRCCVVGGVFVVGVDCSRFRPIRTSGCLLCSGLPEIVLPPTPSCGVVTSSVCIGIHLQRFGARKCAS